MANRRDNAGNGRAPSARKRQIIEIATELFYREGYRAIGMRTIAEETGIQTSSLYHHFPSKEELLYAICLDVTRDFISDYMHLIEGDAPVTERLGRLLRAHVFFFWKHRRQQAVGLRELRELSPEHGREVRRQKRVYQQRIREAIEEGIGRGELDHPDPEIGSLALLDMINSVQRWYQDSGRVSIGHLAELYTGMGLRMLGARGDLAELAALGAARADDPVESST